VLQFHDRNNDCQVRVELVSIRPGVFSWHAALTNAAGENRSGRQRELRVATGSGSGDTPAQPVPDTPGGGGGGGGGEGVIVGPRPANARKWRGNFLCFPGFPMAFMYPGWEPAKRASFCRQYRGAGHTHLPIGVWGSYRDQPGFDYRNDPEGYRRILRELIDAGIEPCVFLHTDAVSNVPAWSRAQVTTWATGYVPRLKDLVRLWCTGWEFNQIDQNSSVYWTGNGQEHLEWARTVRGLIGSDAVLYCHFSPERITGWPNYPKHDGPQDEPGWWGRAEAFFDGLLYQRGFDEDERFTIAHTVGGPDRDGRMDVGDALRISGGHWGVRRDFVCFEFARDVSRHDRLSRVFLQSPHVSGVC
jgi:hypothetical protein